MSAPSTGSRSLPPAQAFLRSHPRPRSEWPPDVQGGRSAGDAARDPCAALPAPALFWTAGSHQERASTEAETGMGMGATSSPPSMYGYTHDGCVGGQEQLAQRAQSRGVHASALHVVGRAPSVRHPSSDPSAAEAHPSGRMPPSGWLPPFRLSADPPPPGIGSVLHSHVPPRLDVCDAVADDGVALRRSAPSPTTYAPRSAGRPLAQASMWAPGNEPTRIQPPAFPAMINSDVPSVEQTQPRPRVQTQLQLQSVPVIAQDDDEEHETHAFVCEWMGESGGMCNMDVLGDRVWMSHHLSREHNVIGHERTQRACLWRGCTDTMNKGSLARHVVSRHLRAGASCGFCSKVYSRADVARRHTKKCKVANEVSMQSDQAK